jgi:hypothetical protein
MGYRLVYPKVIRKRERRGRIMTGRDAGRSGGGGKLRLSGAAETLNLVVRAETICRRHPIL